MLIQNGGSSLSRDEVVLFPFDEQSLPFHRGLRVDLVRYHKRIGETKIVLSTGPAGAPDSRGVSYYGTVRRIGDELWMWYLGQGDEDEWHQRVCLARSRDGYNWTKPNLGL